MSRYVARFGLRYADRKWVDWYILDTQRENKRDYVKDAISGGYGFSLREARRAAKRRIKLLNKIDELNKQA